MKLEFHHLVEFRLSPSAQQRIDRLLDLLELVITTRPETLTEDEKAEIVRQIRVNAEKLHGKAEGPTPVHPTSPTT